MILGLFYYYDSNIINIKIPLISYFLLILNVSSLFLLMKLSYYKSITYNSFLKKFSIYCCSFYFCILGILFKGE